jgi:hypothetical protein
VLHKQFTKQDGQSLVLLAILMIGMLAMLALVLDGGNLLAKRRITQNAADAGALAGARTLCITKDSAQAAFMANQYAASNNGDINSQVGILDRTVTVTATLTFDTFFAHLVGHPELTAQASASAGCYPPTSGNKVLPIAWVCHPPIPGAGSTSDDCQEQTITLTQLDFYINNPPPPGEVYPELYIVMNSLAQPDDLSAICVSGGGWLDCDLDDDGDDDLIANGDRSWLDLNGGGGGSSELVDWVRNGFPGNIYEHTWLGGQSGVENNVFQAVGDIVGEIAAIPVYDLICDDYPDPRCASDVHPGDTLVTSAGGNYFYHIIGFAGFYVSCVNAPGVPGAECPGHKVARDLGVIANNTKTIEGYFVTGILPNLSGGDDDSGFDLGVYTLKLIK